MREHKRTLDKDFVRPVADAVTRLLERLAVLISGLAFAQCNCFEDREDASL